MKRRVAPCGATLRHFRRPLLCVARRELRETTVELLARKPAPAHHHATAARDVGQIGERISVEQHEIGAVSDSYRPEGGILAQRLPGVPRDVARAALQNLPRRESRLRHRADLAMERE